MMIFSAGSDTFYVQFIIDFKRSLLTESKVHIHEDLYLEVSLTMRMGFFIEPKGLSSRFFKIPINQSAVGTRCLGVPQVPSSGGLYFV